MKKKTIDKQEGKAEREEDKAIERIDTFMLLQDSIRKIEYIRDVALAHGMNADEEHVGITPEGEQGLGLILESLACDLEKVHDNM